MMLKELKGQVGGTYAAVKPDTKSSEFLQNFMNKFGVPNPEPTHKIHATLLYSRKYLPHYKPQSDLTHEASPDALEIWKTKSGKNCLVLKLKSDSLSNRHKNLMDKHEATYDYPEYKTHISLSYDIGDDFDVSKIDIVDIPDILLTHEYHEVLDTTGK